MTRTLLAAALVAALTLIAAEVVSAADGPGSGGGYGTLQPAIEDGPGSGGGYGTLQHASWDGPGYHPTSRA